MSQSIKNTGVYQRLTSSTNELERMFKDVDEQKSPTDIKKILLLMGLGTLSWVSTYSGLLELIKANSGDIAFTYKLAIGFAVAMLMLMIVYILDQLFAPLNWLLRTVFIAGYIFLTVISVGFGFGFYWKFLESRSEATRSAESAVGQVQGALQGGQSRLEQLESTLTTLTALSTQKAKEERLKGNSCPNSRPGDGPRRRMRDNDAKSFSFAGDFVTRRAQAVATEIKKLNGDMIKISTRHPSTIDPATGTRNAFMKSLNQRLDLTITRFNSFRTDPQLKSIRNNLADRSNRTQFSDGNGGTFKCPDGQLQSALHGVVQAFDQLPLLEKPKIAAVEGSEATIEAFRRLAATIKGLAILKMPPSEDEIREIRKKAVRSLDQKKSPLQLTNVQAGLNDRDYIPLSIAIFVDFCLLLVSINRPMDRLKSLVPIMKDARDGPISGILSSFHATHFAGIREEFSLFQHVVFDWGGHYYVAVPLASNDIQAQYLANLFVSLEGRGIVDRAIIPPGFIVRSKLKKMGSSFAEHRAFRLYKFRAGAWSNIVLDAVMGAAKDVAIANAEEKTLEKFSNGLPNHKIDEDKQDKNGNGIDRQRSANFASLFNDEDQQHISGQNQNIENEQQLDYDQLNHGVDRRTNQQYQPVIEMPRLFRKEAEKQNGNDKNNIITPANFHTGPASNQRPYRNPAHHSAHHPARQQELNRNNHNLHPPLQRDARSGAERKLADEHRYDTSNQHNPPQRTNHINEARHDKNPQSIKPIEKGKASIENRQNPFGLTPMKRTSVEPTDKVSQQDVLKKQQSSEKTEIKNDLNNPAPEMESADILNWPQNEQQGTEKVTKEKTSTEKASRERETTDPRQQLAKTNGKQPIIDTLRQSNHLEASKNLHDKKTKIPTTTDEIALDKQTIEKTKIISEKIAALQETISATEKTEKEQLEKVKTENNNAEKTPENTTLISVTQKTNPQGHDEITENALIEPQTEAEITQATKQQSAQYDHREEDHKEPELAHIAVNKITRWYAKKTEANQEQSTEKLTTQKQDGDLSTSSESKQTEEV